MDNTKKRFTKAAPEIAELVKKYGCSLNENPPFIIFGKYKSKTLGNIIGILAAANNEFHAHILHKEFSRNGSVKIKRTEFHLNPNFSIKKYKEDINFRQEKKKEVK